MNTIIGIGTDISSILRFRNARYPERVASFYLSRREWREAQASRDMAQTLASRFAAKEAVIKAAPGRVNPLDFEIAKAGEKPIVLWRSQPAPYAFHLSIAHEQEYACAAAVCLSV